MNDTIFVGTADIEEEDGLLAETEIPTEDTDEEDDSDQPQGGLIDDTQDERGWGID